MGESGSSRRLAVQVIVCVLLVGQALAQDPPQLRRPGRERDRSVPNGPARDRDEELEAKRRIEADLRRAQLQTRRLYLISDFELGDIGIGSDLYLPADEELDSIAISLRAPQKLYYVTNRRMLLSVDAVPGYVLYVDSDRENQLSWLLRGDVHFLFPSFYVDVWGAVSDELVRDTSELTRLVPRDTTQWGVNTEIKPSSRTSIKASYLVNDIDFDQNDQLFFDDRLDLLERTTSTVMIEGKHHTFPVTSTMIGAVLDDHEFNRVDLRDSDQTYVYVGAQRQVANRSLVARIGYATLDYRDPSVRGYDGLMGDVSLGLDLWNQNRLDVQYRRQLEFSIFQNNTHYLADRLFLEDQHRLTPRLTAHVQAQAGINSYDVPVSTAAGPVKREDELFFIGAGPSYEFFDRFTLGFVIGPWERRSNIPGESADGIRWHVLLSFN